MQEISLSGDAEAYADMSPKDRYQKFIVYTSEVNIYVLSFISFVYYYYLCFFKFPTVVL